MDDSRFDDLEEKVTARLYGLERRVTRLEALLEICFAAIIDGDKVKRDATFAAIDLAASTLSRKVGDPMEEKMFSRVVEDARNISEADTDQVIDRYLSLLKDRQAFYPEVD